MKYFLILLSLFCFFLTGCGNDNSTDTQNQNNSYNASRTSITDNSTVSSTNNLEINTYDNADNTNNETEISSFSTKIYTPEDEARQNNIGITCSKLDGTVVKSRRNLFFL